MKLTQSTALEQEHFDRRSLLPALRYLWLLLVIELYPYPAPDGHFVFIHILLISNMPAKQNRLLVYKLQLIVEIFGNDCSV